MTRNVAHKVCPGKNGHGFGSIRDCRTKLDTQSFSTEKDHKGNCAVPVTWLARASFKSNRDILSISIPQSQAKKFLQN